MILFALKAKNCLSTIISLSFIVICLSQCRSDPKAEDKAEYAAGTKEGYELARYHCGNCHHFVPAQYLDRKTWEKNILPAMAIRLGITVLWESQYVNDHSNNTGGLSFEEWEKILDYYIKTAPENLVIPDPPVPYDRSLALFTPKIPEARSDKTSRTVMVSFDTISNNIYTSDYNTRSLYQWNNDLKLTDSVFLGTPTVGVSYFNDKGKRHKAVFTGIGRMNPENSQLGTLLEFDLGKKLSQHYDTIAFPLPRPVFTVRGDMNNDGLNDWVVCGFGYTETGGISVWNQLPDGKFKENRIIREPGALQAVVQDFNNDGWNDIMVLFGYSDESIRLYLNNHDGSFTEKRLLNFSAVNGSSSFQLVDFNKDGHLDILYSCGDNADFSKIFKPFHGIYIYLGKGDFQYEQAYFYQINGCTKAVAADFDHDGDLDIATIAIYSDLKKRPGETFLYFEQTAPLTFKTYAPPVEKYGRWMTMDVKDYDGDGDEDIVLGNFSMDMIMEQDVVPYWDAHIPFIVLENETNPRKKKQ